ncbi:MAG: formylglycine-generating enzyme family protein [Candidatus Dadabacteria bacterium]|nr:MAG: formylglycine-generating enzyme family protein [Candidatus Dadabacteria bacterium]
MTNYASATGRFQQHNADAACSPACRSDIRNQPDRTPSCERGVHWMLRMLLLICCLLSACSPSSRFQIDVCTHACDNVGQTCSENTLTICRENAQGCREVTSETCEFGCDGAERCAVVACGNSVVDGDEVCDGDTLPCSDLDSVYVSGEALCKSDCSAYDVSSCTPLVCTDADGDGHDVFHATGCPSGSDYCDNDPNNYTQNGCTNCVDNDGDGYGTACDLGTDCNDANPSVFATTSDCTPPDTNILSGPAGVTDISSATFTFTCSETGCTYECRLDNGSWSSCSSPKSYVGLAGQQHLFEVRASDAALNVDATPASRAFTSVSVWQLIPGGSFSMGDGFSEGDADELPVHTVTVSTFQMMSKEVTNGAYEACVNAGACGAPGSGAASFGYGSTTGTNPWRPVLQVTWNNAVEYCSWVGGRLPTEAEWEYAARGGHTDRRFPNGNTMNCSLANYFGQPFYPYDTEPSAGTCVGTTVRVGSYAPNDYGLYDITGNVAEWVFDWYGANYYSSSATTNPQGPASGTNRIVRGGDWNANTFRLRNAERTWATPGSQGNIGIRCAR